jgi:hypothetical protein
MELDQAEKFNIPIKDFEQNHPGILDEVRKEIKNHQDSMVAPPSIIDEKDLKYLICCDPNRNCICD